MLIIVLQHLRCHQCVEKAVNALPDGMRGPEHVLNICDVGNVGAEDSEALPRMEATNIKFVQSDRCSLSVRIMCCSNVEGQP